jgi:hypothetical protein
MTQPTPTVRRTGPYGEPAEPTFTPYLHFTSQSFLHPCHTDTDFTPHMPFSSRPCTVLHVINKTEWRMLIMKPPIVQLTCYLLSLWPYCSSTKIMKLIYNNIKTFALGFLDSCNNDMSETLKCLISVSSWKRKLNHQHYFRDMKKKAHVCAVTHATLSLLLTLLLPLAPFNKHSSWCSHLSLTSLSL